MRKRSAKKRPLLPDPRFSDQLVTRFVNNLMWSGKKSVAFKIFYDAIDIVDEKKQDEDKSALDNNNQERQRILGLFDYIIPLIETGKDL